MPAGQPLELQGLVFSPGSPVPLVTFAPVVGSSWGGLVEGLLPAAAGLGL